MVCEVHNLLRLYLTITITSATAERSFSALQNVLTYLRSSMIEQRLNNCMLIHIYKQLTDFIQIAKEFIAINAERKCNRPLVNGYIVVCINACILPLFIV